MAMTKTWRQRAQPIIAQIIAENKDKSVQDIRRALRDAYPWGERAMHPYKVWRDEVKKQIKLHESRNQPVEQGNLFSLQ